MDLNQKIMKELENIRDIEQIEKLENEYDFQKALLLDKKLRLMVKEQPELRPLRKKLRRLMTEYEERFREKGQPIYRLEAFRPPGEPENGVES